MCVSTIVSFTADATFGFAVKNCFCYYGIEKVRTGLQQTITEIAKPHFGTFVAPVVGSQLGLVLALPVTLFYGDMLTFAIKKVLLSVRALFTSLFYDITDTRANTSLFREVAVNIVSFSVGFFAKLYFCNYAMGHVGTALRHIGVLSAPVLGLSLPVVMVMPAIIVMITPTVTFVLGDFVAYTTGHATYDMLMHSCRVLFDKPCDLSRTPLPTPLKPQLHRNAGHLD